MTVVTANDLKIRGISDIERLLKEEQEVVISVRGKSRYVVIDVDRYDYLRECELTAAWNQSRADLAAGRYKRETADEHMARIEDEAAHEL